MKVVEWALGTAIIAVATILFFQAFSIVFDSLAVIIKALWGA